MFTVHKQFRITFEFSNFALLNIHIFQYNAATDSKFGHHHHEHAASWSVAVSTRCCQWPLSWANLHAEFRPRLWGWSASRYYVDVQGDASNPWGALGLTLWELCWCHARYPMLPHARRSKAIWSGWVETTVAKNRLGVVQWHWLHDPYMGCGRYGEDRCCQKHPLCLVSEPYSKTEVVHFIPPTSAVHLSSKRMIKICACFLKLS